MARRIPGRCRHGWCNKTATTSKGYCDAHQKQAWKEEAAKNRHRTRFYDSTNWRKVRDTYRLAYPLCALCESRGVFTQMKFVDHITPIREGGGAFNWDNLQSLCERCHNEKRGEERHHARFNNSKG